MSSSGVWIALALVLPTALVLLTSFVKITVVLTILRSALGTAGVPPLSVITAVALVLTAYVMAPTAVASWEAAAPSLEALPDDPGPVDLLGAIAPAADPVRTFLVTHARPSDVASFAELWSARSGAPTPPDSPAAGALPVLVPAFLVSELTRAFQIGFLLFLPFLVLDLFVAGSLASVGLSSLNPQHVAVPFKLLLFVLVDGWGLLTRGLVESYF